MSAAESFQNLRIARYSVYPRAASGHAVQTAFTTAPHRGADRELCLVTTAPEAVGELLRICIQDLDEPEASETLARVVECDRRGEGGFELTVEALDSHRPRLVRRMRA
jgi:hypothetical protein